MSGTNQQYTVLIVEDDQSSRESLASALIELGFHVLTAEDGQDALDQLGHTSVHVIVSDLMMPHVTGLELLQRVKTQWPNTPFILVTAFATTAQAQEALELGAFDCLPKPIDLIDLESAVERALHVN